MNVATKAQIRDKVLRKLKILRFGQAAFVEDATIVEDAYDELHAQLSEDNVITWGSTDDIPDEAVASIVKIVAYEVGDVFLGATEEVRYNRLRAEAYGLDGNSGAFGVLKSLASIDYVPTQTEATYY
jgi:hypothetical protein